MKLQLMSLFSLISLNAVCQDSQVKYITDRTGYEIKTTKENCKVITDDLKIVNDLTWFKEDSLRYMNVQYLNTKEGRVRHYTLYFPLSMEDSLRNYLRE